MKNTYIKTLSITLIVGISAFILSSCERTLSDDVRPATFSKTAAIFNDNFVGLGSDFYFPYLGAKPDVFSVDTEEAYNSASSIRIDVPNANDPGGNFAGAIFRVDGSGRNLTEFDALTFWARASQAVTIDEFGFGQNFGLDAFRVVMTQVDVTTNWQKIIIPIPDPSILIEERGVFQFAAGALPAPILDVGDPANGVPPTYGPRVGYTFWVDDLKFEKLGTIAQPRPAIFNGQEQTVTSFNDETVTVTGLTQTLNLSDGTDKTVIATPAYFDFVSSDLSVATVNEAGQISVLSAGTAIITASLDGVAAAGSITINSAGPFQGAPTPPERDPSNVVSIFSDAYDNVTVDNYNGFFQFATTQGGATSIAGDNFISYTELNFVSVNMYASPDVDARTMTHIHVDINVREAISGSDYIRFQIINNDGGASGSNGTVNLGSYSPLLEEQWVSYDIPLTDFNGLNTIEDIDLIFFISDATISNIYVDNIYFYKQ